jgi:hypothetical protein
MDRVRHTREENRRGRAAGMSKHPIAGQGGGAKLLFWYYNIVATGSLFMRAGRVDAVQYDQAG